MIPRVMYRRLVSNVTIQDIVKNIYQSVVATVCVSDTEAIVAHMAVNPKHPRGMPACEISHCESFSRHAGMAGAR